MSLKAQWEAEKSVLTEIRYLKEKLENLKTEQAQAQGEGKFFCCHFHHFFLLLPDRQLSDI